MKKGRTQLEKLVLQIQVLIEENEELRAENKRQKEQIDYLIRQKFGRKSEKINPNQLMLMLDLDEHPAQEESEPDTSPENDPPPSENKPKRKRRHIKDRLPEDLPVRTEVIDPPEVQEEPNNYRCIGEEVHTELSMTPPVYFLKKTVRRKFVKKDDREKAPIIVPALPRLIDNSIASPELLTDIIIKKYIEHLPLYRQAESLKRFMGIDISYKTMNNWVWHIGNWLRIIYDELREEVRASGYLQADETVVKYIKPGAGHAIQGYLFAYHAINIGVIFEWHQGRGAKHLESMLAGYTGALQCDGYKIYQSFLNGKEYHDRYVLYACWAHARRMFHEARHDSDLAVEVLNHIRKLYCIEKNLRKSNSSNDERYIARKESKIILKEIKKLLDTGLMEYLPQSLTGKAITYTLTLWKELERYADTGHIEIDNNLVENAIRPTAIGKKNWLFFGSPDSGQQSAIIYSILETCRKLGIDQKEYLYDILKKLPYLTAQEARQLTPLKWLRERAKNIA